MTRIVGSQDRSEFILDPVEAWHRGRILDQMLAQAQPPRPRGVFRGTHAALQRLDEARRVDIARRLNQGWSILDRVNAPADPLLKLLERFQQEGVQYILVGGHAVRLNGFLRSTEDIDILLPSSIDNGKRVIRALNFLPSAGELRPEWFAGGTHDPENIRVADELLIDLLFAANGETYESLQAHVRSLNVEGVDIRTLDIEGLLKTKTTYRDKDVIDRKALSQILAQLKAR